MRLGSVNKMAKKWKWELQKKKPVTWLVTEIKDDELEVNDIFYDHKNNELLQAREIVRGHARCSHTDGYYSDVTTNNQTKIVPRGLLTDTHRCTKIIGHPSKYPELFRPDGDTVVTGEIWGYQLWSHYYECEKEAKRKDYEERKWRDIFW